MNNLQRAVEDIGKEFDEKFGFLKAVHSTSGKEPIDQIHDFLSDSIKKVLEDFVRETKLPYHSSFTTAEMAGTEEVRLLTADNSGWNRAVDDIQSKQREYLGEL